MQKIMHVLLMLGLMLSASSTVLAQPVWQLGPVSQQMCSNIQGIMTGEEEIVYILTQLIDGKIDGTAAADVVNKAQEHIRNEFINSLSTIISQQSSGSDLEYARSLLPNIKSTFSNCDMKVSTFLTLKQIDKDGLQRVQNACRVAPENLYNSYCQPPSPPECADRGKQTGMSLWRTFKSGAGAALCEKLSDVNTELVKKLIEKPATSCDDAFNNALSEYIDQQVTQTTKECGERPTPIPTFTPVPIILTPTPIPIPTSTPVPIQPVSFGIRGGKMHVVMSNGQDIVVPNIPDYNANNGFWLPGDFNGDGVMDLLHMVTNGVATPNYCHVHFSNGNGGFRAPTKFAFPCSGIAPCGYDIRRGEWGAEDLDGDRKTDLKHNPKLPDNRRHCWFSMGDGSFQLKACP